VARWPWPPGWVSLSLRRPYKPPGHTQMIHYLRGSERRGGVAIRHLATLGPESLLDDPVTEPALTLRTSCRFGLDHPGAYKFGYG
jgi:hypothetical protein